MYRTEQDMDTYDLTRYINDINQEYTQTLMEYNTETLRSRCPW